MRTVDAGLPASYARAAPSDVVLMVGILGNIADADVRRLISFAPQLCRRGATLIWSLGRAFRRPLPGVTAHDLNDEIRARFRAARFSEVAYETHDGEGRPALGVVRYDGPPVALQVDRPQLFTFLR